VCHVGNIPYEGRLRVQEHAGISFGESYRVKTAAKKPSSRGQFRGELWSNAGDEWVGLSCDRMYETPLVRGASWYHVLTLCVRLSRI
jgi:hypothetical protein